MPQYDKVGLLDPSERDYRLTFSSLVVQNLAANVVMSM